MRKPGYYIFLFSDVIGYTSVRIYPNDNYLISDLQRNFEAECIDFISYYRETKQETLTLVSNFCEEYGISVRDFSGDILEKCEFYTFDKLVDKLNLIIKEMS